MLAWREPAAIRSVKIKVIRLRALYFKCSRVILVDRTLGLNEQLLNLLWAFRIYVVTGIPSRQLIYR